MRHPLRELPTALGILLLAAIFFRAASAPIAPVDTWNHWKYGEWIWQHEKLPDREPFSPGTSDSNRPVVDPAWLAEVAGYLVYARAGMEGIVLFYGLAEVLKTVLLLAAFRRVCGSPWLGLFGAVLVLAGSWDRFGIFRPEVLGEVCWAAVLFLVGWAESSRRTGITRPQPQQGIDPVGLQDSAHPTSNIPALGLLPCIFVLWANLDASFVVGLFCLAVLVIGQFLQGDHDRGLRGLVLATAASWAAASVNPYGPSLIGTVVSHVRSGLLQGVPEWQPFIPLATYSAKAFAISVLVVLATLRFSPRPFSAADALLLATFGLATWFAGRLLPWWMMLWPFVLLPHWREIGNRVRGAHPMTTRVRSMRPTLPLAWSKLAACRWPAAAAITVGIAIVLASGTGRWLLRGAARPEAEQVAPGTPVEVADQLDSLLSRRTARVLASPLWCDYLLWRMPPAGTLFVYDQYDAFPPKNLAAYVRIVTMQPPPDDWRTLLDRYGIDVVALSAEAPRKDLFAHFLHGKEPGWQIFYVNTAATELVAERVR